ncbi:Egg cell-secreted protein 1.4 [Platanthera zijinensis]|uniref:Egg cell-secreted protein 1.4 n=1 Tax=Platanthera zijinensis TaxID=2320716 RepID=A0AAP0BVZ9_9ASPA
MLELRSFTDEIILFFLNGESYLSLECCRSIRVITHHCWPSMLTALGFTAEEGSVLGGFCDADAATTPPAPAPAPAALLDDAFAAEWKP